MTTSASTFKIAPADDTLAQFRAEFVIPTNKQMKATAVTSELEDEPCTYLCGNSLGLQPKRSRKLVEEELDIWATRSVEGHFDHPYGREWMYIADKAHPLLAEIVGAKEAEVACMGSLTTNLHLMLDTFYKPTAERYKILCEARAFPSDQYAFASQVQSHGYTPEDAIIELSPRPGEYTLRTEDILAAIAQDGPRIALVLFPGCQYYTGQVFRFAVITAASKAQGCICGWDLAHAVGNVPLQLHAWGVDFAVWCTYKYLNSGPGAVGGLFVNERWDGEPIRAAGWWGHDPKTRFDMPPRFSAIKGAQGFQQSNANVLSTAAHIGALEIFREAGGIGPLRARGVRLTGYLEALLQQSRFFVPLDVLAKEEPGEKGKDGSVGFTIITPGEEERGQQLSLVFVPTGRGIMPRVQRGLAARGVVGDSRKPDVIRLAPCPLYTTWADVERGVEVLNAVLSEVDAAGM